MNEPTLRQATTADHSPLLALEQALIEAERPFDSTLKPGAVCYYDIMHFIEDPNTFLVVADVQGRVVGAGYVQLRSSNDYYSHDQHGYLGFIFVDAEYRGMGLANRIIDRLKAWANERGVTYFTLDVYADNQAALAAYERAGFKRVAVKMALEAEGQ
jgi:ribosomal protein S18 acetylase RimI-like enzyme